MKPFLGDAAVFFQHTLKHQNQNVSIKLNLNSNRDQRSVVWINLTKLGFVYSVPQLRKTLLRIFSTCSQI